MIEKKLLEEIDAVLISYGFQNYKDKHFNENEYVYFDKTWNNETGGAKYMIFIDTEHEDISCRDISDEKYYMGKNVFGMSGKKIKLEKIKKIISKL